MEDLGKIWYRLSLSLISFFFLRCVFLVSHFPHNTLLNRTLSDINKDQLLDREEFVIAMYLINTRLKGRPLPDTLPVSLRPSVPVQVRHLYSFAVPCA